VSSREYDVLVVGGGPAGYYAGLITAVKGLKTLLVEEERIGGTCLNKSCVPLATLLKYLSTTDLIDKLSREGVGISVSNLSIDAGKLFNYVRSSVVNTLSESMRKTLEDLGVDVFNGKAVLVNDSTAKVGDSYIKFKKAIIATGLKWGSGSGVRPCTEFIDLNELPSKVLIIGCNPFGLSIASIYSMLGSEVIVVDEGSEVLKDFDKEVVNYLMLALAERGVEVMTDTVVNSVVVKQGVREVRLVRGNEVLTVGVDEVFNASVCNPRLDVLGGLNIKLRDGYVWVDASLRTSVGNIYAAGDVTGLSTYAHTAIVQGVVAGVNVSGGNMSFTYRVSPRYTFTYPEIFSVGLTEDEARSLGYEVLTARQSLTSNALAKASMSSGMVKVVVDSRYGGVLGVHAVGYGISEVVNEASIAVTLESTSDTVINTLLAHPTLGEVLRDALLQVLKV